MQWGTALPRRPYFTTLNILIFDPVMITYVLHRSEMGLVNGRENQTIIHQLVDGVANEKHEVFLSIGEKGYITNLISSAVLPCP